MKLLSKLYNKYKRKKASKITYKLNKTSVGIDIIIRDFIETFKTEHGRAPIFAVDFDNTLFKTKYPTIIHPHKKMIKMVKTLQEYGAYIILWTCRTNEDLEAAVNACAGENLYFDKINDHSEVMLEKFNNAGKKIFADYYLDDRAFNVNINKGFGNKELIDIL